MKLGHKYTLTKLIIPEKRYKLRLILFQFYLKQFLEGVIIIFCLKNEKLWAEIEKKPMLRKSRPFICRYHFSIDVLKILA